MNGFPGHIAEHSYIKYGDRSYISL